MEQNLTQLKAASMAQYDNENKKIFDCGNLFSVLGIIGMIILIKTMLG